MSSSNTRDAGGVQARPSTFKLVVIGVITLVLVGIFLSLGTWQVHRRAWKLDLIQKVDSRVHAPPVAAPVPAQWPQVNAANDEYRHVSLSGTYQYDRDTLVQAVTDFGGGFWVLTPLRTADGHLVMVNRGFVPPGWKETGTAGDGAPVNVTGLLRMTEPNGGFLRKNDPAQNLWYSRDVQAIATARGIGDVAPFFIDADGPAGTARPLPNGDGEATVGAAPKDQQYPVGGLTVIQFPNNHLSYIITWYALALMAAAAGIFVLRLEVRGGRRGSRD